IHDYMSYDMCFSVYFILFFFSSRRRHTRFKCDWSSDVCSSDLEPAHPSAVGILRTDEPVRAPLLEAVRDPAGHAADGKGRREERSEERRVGKECRCWWEQDG